MEMRSENTITVAKSHAYLGLALVIITAVNAILTNVAEKEVNNFSKTKPPLDEYEYRNDMMHLYLLEAFYVAFITLAAVSGIASIGFFSSSIYHSCNASEHEAENESSPLIP